jgi:hypothetical protein
VPSRADVQDLVVRLDAAKAKPGQFRKIALEFTAGNESKADSLLTQVRRLRREGKVTLSADE